MSLLPSRSKSDRLDPFRSARPACSFLSTGPLPCLGHHHACWDNYGGTPTSMLVPALQREPHTAARARAGRAHQARAPLFKSSSDLLRHLQEKPLPATPHEAHRGAPGPLLLVSAAGHPGLVLQPLGPAGTTRPSALGPPPLRQPLPGKFPAPSSAAGWLPRVTRNFCSERPFPSPPLKRPRPISAE